MKGREWEMSETVQDKSMEEIAFGLIAAAGNARGLAFEALKAARAGEFDRADELLKQSQDAGIEAHHIQMGLLSKEAGGDHVPVDIMLVHAQDHLMCAMLAQELIAEIVYLHKIGQDR